MQLSDVETTYRKCKGLVLHSEWIMLGLRCVLEYGMDGGRTNPVCGSCYSPAGIITCRNKFSENGGAVKAAWAPL